MSRVMPKVVGVRPSVTSYSFVYLKLECGHEETHGARRRRKPRPKRVMCMKCSNASDEAERLAGEREGKP